MHPAIGVVLLCLTLIYRVSCGVIEKQVTKYVGETVQLSCFTDLDEPAEWGIRSVLQRYLLQTPEGHDGYRRIYSTAGLQTAYIWTGRYSMSIGNGFYNMTIKNLNISENGEYVCWEALGGGPQSSTQLFVYENISMLHSYDSSVVYAGDDVTLLCQCNDDGPTRWLYIKSERSSQDVISNDNSIELKYRDWATVTQTNQNYNLSLHNVQLNQSGFYICIEDGLTFFKHPIRLTVFVNISSLQSRRELVVYDGNHITPIPCRASLPGPSITWTYSKSHITPQNVIFDRNAVSSKYSSKISASFNETTLDYNLSLHNVQLNESGWYICIEDGAKIHPVFLTVRVNVSQEPSAERLPVDIGDNVTLLCRTNLGGPLRWLYIPSQNGPQYVVAIGNNVELNFTDKVTVLVNQTTGDYNLSLHDVHDLGWYVCLEDNDIVNIIYQVIETFTPGLSSGAIAAIAVIIVTVWIVVIAAVVYWFNKGRYQRARTDDVDQFDLAKYSRTIVPITSSNGDQLYVTGLTQLDNSIYIVTWQEKAIRVYDGTHPCDPYSEIDMTVMLKQPMDLVSCNVNKLLFVSDLSGDVWRVNVNSANEVDKFIHLDYGAKRLSLTSQRLLVTPKSGQLMLVYDVKSKERLYSFELPTSPTPIEPRHAVELNTKFIVCHRRSDNDYGLSEVDRENSVLLPAWSTVGLLQLPNADPYYLALYSDCQLLAIDEDLNITFLSKDRNLEVLLGSKKLVGKKISTASHQRMYFNLEKKTLIVAMSYTDKKNRKYASMVIVSLKQNA